MDTYVEHDTKIIHYAEYFRVGHPAKIIFGSNEGEDFELTGVVRFMEKNLITVELVLHDPDCEQLLVSGSDLFVTSWSRWSHYRCKVVLVKKVLLQKYLLRLTGQVVEKQNREHFRIDTSLPYCYSQFDDDTVPDGGLHSRENRVKVNGKENLVPQPINLSASGARIEVPEALHERSLVALDLFVPQSRLLVIPLVAEILRCSKTEERKNQLRYVVAMYFRLITEKDRESLISFIFAEQRRSMSKVMHSEFL